MKKTLALKITYAFAAMILACALILSAVSYYFYRSDNIDSNAERALDIARTVAAAIDGDQFAQIMATKQKTAHWHAVKSIADNTRVSTGVAYLYILDSSYSSTATYFAEGYDSSVSDEEELDLGVEEDLGAFDDLLFETLRTGKDTMTGIYDSEGFGLMVSGFTAVKNSAGQVVGVVGADINVDEVTAASGAFALQLVITAIVLCAVLGLVCIRLISTMVGKPVTALAQAADSIALGDLTFTSDTSRQDEIGALSSSFSKMVTAFQAQADVLQQMATGDFTASIQPRSQHDVVNRAINELNQNVASMLTEINQTSSQVSTGAGQIAEGAQSLAAGSTQQAAAVQQLSASIGEIYTKSEENTREAVSAFEDTEKAGQFMAESMDSMRKMTEAMQEINNASQAISKVIGVIENIAFQTNILSLNASVEAARAGQHGRGFAVVAEEVRNLANKSATAAKETAELIQNSIDRVNEGNTIAADTSRSLDAVAELAKRNADAMAHISEASQRQSAAIAEINQGIEQISSVVQTTSATAQESAASSQEMSAQAQILSRIVQRFKLEDSGQPSLQAPGFTHSLPAARPQVQQGVSHLAPTNKYL